MKYLIAAAVLAVGLFVTTGTASAQHYGGSHGSTYGHGVYTAPRVGVYPVPSHGGYYQPSYGVGVYSRPVYSGSVHGGYAGHSRHSTHHDRHGHR